MTAGDEVARAAPIPGGAPATSSGARVPLERLVALDTFRGFTMFWLLGGKAFVVACAALLGLDFVRTQLAHSDWVGLRYYDLIWPSFMLMVGMAVPFSFARRAQTQTRGEMMRAAWKRAAVLFLLGSLRESVSLGKPQLIELSSALQPIALAYLVTSYLAGQSVRLQAAVAGGILAGYGLLLALVPAGGAPAGSYVIHHNLVSTVDQAILGRTHRDGWGTVLSAIPPIAVTIVGLILGQVLLSANSTGAKMRVIGAAGTGSLLLGWGLSPVIPVIMKLWTTTYALMALGWSCLLFLCFYFVTDVCRVRRWALPLIVIGVNALAAYLLPTLVSVSRLVGPFTKPFMPALGAFGPVVASGAVLLAGWLILGWMYRRRIFLRP